MPEKRYSDEISQDEKRGFNSNLCKQYNWNFLKKSENSSCTNPSSSPPQLFHRDPNSSSTADIFKNSSSADIFESRENKERNFTSIQGKFQYKENSHSENIKQRTPYMWYYILNSIHHHILPYMWYYKLNSIHHHILPYMILLFYLSYMIQIILSAHKIISWECNLFFVHI